MSLPRFFVPQLRLRLTARSQRGVIVTRPSGAAPGRRRPDAEYPAQDSVGAPKSFGQFADGHIAQCSFIVQSNRLGECLYEVTSNGRRPVDGVILRRDLIREEFTGYSKLFSQRFDMGQKRIIPDFIKKLDEMCIEVDAVEVEDTADLISGP